METPLQSATRFCTPSESAKIRKKYAPPNTVHVGPISQMCRVGYVARTYRVNEASSAQLADVPSAACQAARATRVASGAAGKSTCLRLVQRLLLLHSNGTSFLDEEAAYAQVAKQHPKECGALARRGAGSALGRCCQVPMEVDGDPSTAATFLVGLVMPIHPPHFAYGVHFIASMALHGHTRARGTRVEYFPVLSSVADRDGFRQSLATAAATGTHAPLSGQSVSGRDHGPWIFSGGVAVHPLLVALDAAPAGEYGKLAPATTKKLLGVREAFAQRRALRYALAIDAEVEFVSDHSFVHTLRRWYERADFDAFLSRFNWTRNHNFDHASYLCYKIEARGWRIVDTSAYGVNAQYGKCQWPEYFSRAMQDRFCQSSLWIWTPWSAREAQAVRLLRFHLDRSNHSAIPGTADDARQ